VEYSDPWLILAHDRQAELLRSAGRRRPPRRSAGPWDARRRSAFALAVEIRLPGGRRLRMAAGDLASS
jgi:hypothetical protein